VRQHGIGGHGAISDHVLKYTFSRFSSSANEPPRVACGFFHSMLPTRSRLAPRQLHARRADLTDGLRDVLRYVT
jgi:hypothetical protein